LYYNALSTGRPAGEVDLTHPPHDTESKYISRYIDEQNTPQFPFGYGLSYTTFEYGATRVSKAQVSAAELNRALAAGTKAAALNVEATVANTGSRAAEETVQLYVRLVGTSTAQPVRALKGFQHVMLAAGETKTVRFELASEALAIWNASNQFAVEPAKATVWISPDSARGTGAPVTVLP
jgi:beta-glucosidase